jgi:hypothetical protein
MEEDVKRRNNLWLMLLIVGVCLAVGILEVTSYVSTSQKEWVKFVNDCDCQCIKGINPNATPNVNWDWDVFRNGSDTK